MGTLTIYILLGICIICALMPLTWLWYRLLGIRVNAMAIGAGPVLLKRQLAGTTWELKALFFIGYSAELEGMAAFFENDPAIDKSALPHDDFRALPAWRRYLIGLGSAIPLGLLASALAGIAYPWTCILGFPAAMVDLILKGGQTVFWGPAAQNASIGFPHFLGIMASWLFAMQFFPFSGTFCGNTLTLILIDVFGLGSNGKGLEILTYISFGLGMGLMILIGLSFFGILS